MCARSSEPGRARPGAAGGFTLVELIAVLMLVSVLAVVALPRMGGATALRAAAWRDQIKAGLLHGRVLAQGHRRLVCATVITGEIRLTLAAANPASSCSVVVPGPDGDARWAVDSQAIGLTVAPAGSLYFQPDGRITSDGAGLSTVNATVTVTGEPALQLSGETGYVH